MSACLCGPVHVRASKSKKDKRGERGRGLRGTTDPSQTTAANGFGKSYVNTKLKMVAK